MTVLKLGSRGEEVKTLQQKLNLIVDGIFGPLTEEAVKEFQKANGLAADGIAGQKTLDKLEILRLSKRQIKEIILHCTATPEGKNFTIADIRRSHLARGFTDIGYHYVIYLDGTVHNGRNVDISGAHCLGHNSKSIGIAYVGGVEADNKTPKDTRTEAQRKSLKQLVKTLLDKYKLDLSNVFCHYQFANKACPSFKLEDFKKEFK